MLKQLVIASLSLLIVSCGPAPNESSDSNNSNVESGRGGRFYSVATICDSDPKTDEAEPSSESVIVREDDWRQIEFVGAENRSYILAKLAESENFRKQHRNGRGFTDVFVRPEHPFSLRSLNLNAEKLPRLPQLPLSFADGNIPDGFALGDESDWFIYGERSAEGKILELAVSPGRGTLPSPQFIKALIEIAGSQLLLVDWNAGVVVDATSPESVKAWARHYESTSAP